MQTRPLTCAVTWLLASHPPALAHFFRLLSIGFGSNLYVLAAPLLRTALGKLRHFQCFGELCCGRAACPAPRTDFVACNDVS
ncbi:hypothetical protein AMELA_G00083810 [Ameiurus melas]|uniref:Uncharacterized protein n=1 Tax=Ameiurus melas TaxID=219545 RepID=A0A7J6B0A8_AMEME|nr:hypothetical protein AMELA_G00083810 [Ameiurus melas]